MNDARQHQVGTQASHPRQRRGRVTLQDVSKEAGLAVSTVSAVLRHETRCWVSDATRKRVFEAARRVNYRPNKIARALRAQKVNLIGLILPSLNMAAPAMSKVALVEEMICQAGYQVIIGNHHESDDRLRDSVNEVVDHQVAGLVIVPGGRNHAGVAGELIAQNIPAVTIDALKPEVVPDVSVDRVHGAYLQVRHLLHDAGCRKLAFLSTRAKIGPGYLKYTGYEQALAEAGSSLAEHAVFDQRPAALGVDEYNFGYVGVKQLRASGCRFDGIVTGSDTVALGAMRALAEAGLRVPTDVAVVGFDDQPFAASLMPPLTTICNPPEVGREAVKQLMRQIDAGPAEAVPLQHTCIKPRLVTRASTMLAVTSKAQADLADAHNSTLS